MGGLFVVEHHLNFAPRENQQYYWQCFYSSSVASGWPGGGTGHNAFDDEMYEEAFCFLGKPRTERLAPCARAPHYNVVVMGARGELLES